jgi:uncharacterized protein
MKKSLIKYAAGAFMALALVFMLPFCVSAKSAGINDTANLLTDAQEQELEQIQQKLADKTGWNIIVVVSDGYGSKSAMAFTDDLYDETFGINTDGIAFLYDMNDRYLSTSGIAINYLNDSRIEQILDDVDKYYYDKKDYEALKALYSDIEYYYDQGIRSDNYVYEGTYSGEEAISTKVATQVFIGFVAGVIAALIGVSIVIRRYKFHQVPSANSYLNRGTVNFYRRSDMFIREFTTRTRISSDSGGGGSSTHHSSGGGSHGGGGHSGHR